MNRQGLSARTKHFDVKHLYIQELVKTKKPYIGTIGTKENVADLGAKYVDRERELFSHEGNEICAIEQAFICNSDALPSQGASPWSGYAFTMISGAVVDRVCMWVADSFQKKSEIVKVE